MKKIRKTIAFLLLSLVSASGYAEKVSLDRALQAAKGFFRIEAETKGIVPGELTLVYQGSRKSSADSPFYVFNNSKGGFVMIAGDTQSTPVLAYSNEDSFFEGELPVNVKEWMDNMESHIENLRRRGVVDDSGTPERWEHLSSEIVKGYSVVVDLKTPKWNQTEPFNAYCPKGTYTGCVATAMAEILWYHKWPDAGVGTLKGYSYLDENQNKIFIKGYELGHEYNWSIMPASVVKTKELTDAQKEIATLMHDCGVMVEAMYGTDGTGAYSSNVTPALVEHMKYDASANFLYGPWFSTDEWLDMIYRNLDNGIPVYYSASTKDNAGHAFVLDGYASDGGFHINFGWGGSGNGYYVFPQFSDYTEYHDMIVNLKPDEGGLPEEMLLLYDLTVTDMQDNPVESFEVNGQYKLKTGIYNMGQVPYSGRLAWALYDHDDVLKAYITDTVNVVDNRVENLDDASVWISFTLDEAPEIGDKLRLMYCGDNNGDWRRITYYKGENYDVYLEDPTFIDESTTFEIQKASGKILINTKDGVEFTVTDLSGADLTEQAAVFNEEDGTIEVDLKSLQKGIEYIFTLSKGKDIKTMQIKL